MASLSSSAAKAKAEKERKRMVGGAKTSATRSSKVGPTPIDDVKMKYGGTSLTGLGAPIPQTRWGDTLKSVNATSTYTAPKATTTSDIQPMIGQDRPTYVSGNAVGTETGVNQASTSGSATGATGTDINANLTGNVGSYGIRRDAIPMLYQEPQALLRMAMASMGQSANQNPGMYNMALPTADLVNALTMIGLGGNKDYNAGEHDKVLNYMDDLFRQGLTRGGQVVDFSQGMSNLTNAEAGSPLESMLQNDDPRGQYSALSSLMLPLAEAGLHPLFARSLQKSMESLRDEYYSRYANGTPPTSMVQGMNDRLGLGG